MPGECTVRTDRTRMSVARLLLRWLTLLALLTATGCVSISYRPALSLPTSERRLEVRARIEEFTDARPQEDAEPSAFGISATSPSSMSGDLRTEVTNAVASDFMLNGVFAEVSKSLPAPDVIVRGTIRRFSAKCGPNALYWILLPVSPLMLFGLPVNSLDGAVQIELIVCRADGTEIGHYSSAADVRGGYAIWDEAGQFVPAKLNAAFNRVMMYVREDLIADAAKIEAARAEKPQSNAQAADGERR